MAPSEVEPGSVVFHAPGRQTSGMRSEVKPEDIIRAVAKAIEATFDRSDWMELGLITGTLHYIKGHQRLLRSLDWGDPDYRACVIEAVPVILGDQAQTGTPFDPLRPSERRFENLAEVEAHLGLEPWLRVHEPALHRALYAGEDTVIVDDLQGAARYLGIEDVDEHAARIRRGLREDPAQAVGSSKELLETVLKAVLGLHGSGPETKVDLPHLVKEANVRLGLDAAGVRGDEPGASQRRRLFSSLAHIVHATAELRNAGFGTGHGGVQRPTLDVATARLAVSSAVAVATFYIEAYSAQGARHPSDDEFL